MMIMIVLLVLGSSPCGAVLEAPNLCPELHNSTCWPFALASG